MPKPTIFISHISEEKEVALLFKNEIERYFLGMVDIFVSSDAKSIQLGSNWLDSITTGLRECAAILLFCSPYSIKRPWINFECGAGWGRGIEIAPICHSGLRPVDLPLPMSLLQGVEASNPKKIQEVFDLIARNLGSNTPQIDAEKLTASILEFERKYKTEKEINENLIQIKIKDYNLFKILKGFYPSKVKTINGFPQINFMNVKEYLDKLQILGSFEYSATVSSFSVGPNSPGAIMTLTIRADKDVIEAVQKIPD